MLNELSDFLARPYSSDMSATRWFLFLGLILVSLWAWGMIQRDVASLGE